MTDPWRYCCPCCGLQWFELRSTTGDYRCRHSGDVFEEPHDKKIDGRVMV